MKKKNSKSGGSFEPPGQYVTPPLTKTLDNEIGERYLLPLIGEHVRPF